MVWSSNNHWVGKAKGRITPGSYLQSSQFFSGRKIKSSKRMRNYVKFLTKKVVMCFKWWYWCGIYG